jgi:hypothetical protein
LNKNHRITLWNYSHFSACAQKVIVFVAQNVLYPQFIANCSTLVADLCMDKILVLIKVKSRGYVGMRRKVLLNPQHISVAFRRPTQCDKFEYQYQSCRLRTKAALLWTRAECIVTCCYHLSYFHIHGCANLLIVGANAAQLLWFNQARRIWLGGDAALHAQKKPFQALLRKWFDFHLSQICWKTIDRLFTPSSEHTSRILVRKMKNPTVCFSISADDVQKKCWGWLSKKGEASKWDQKYFANSPLCPVAANKCGLPRMLAVKYVQRKEKKEMCCVSMKERGHLSNSSSRPLD